MHPSQTTKKVFLRDGADYHHGFSVDCVIFGFHDNQLKVLLLEARYSGYWGLAGGFVRKEEDIDTAANHVLQNRTGLTDIFLRQFHVFGKSNRADRGEIDPQLSKEEAEAPHHQWLAKRFITAGYYALVDFTTVQPRPNAVSKSCVWWELNNLPALMLDHQQIIDKALETLRMRLRHEPIGYKLLPEKFTMPELQKLYEAILGRALDRRNFQRKMLCYGVLQALDEHRTGGAHKAPRLYSFDLPNYQLALEQGWKGGW